MVCWPTMQRYRLDVEALRLSIGFGAAISPGWGRGAFSPFSFRWLPGAACLFSPAYNENYSANVAMLALTRGQHRANGRGRGPRAGVGGCVTAIFTATAMIRRFLL